MLRAEENENRSRTPMGDLFRRYWLPALKASEIPDADSPPVRLQLLSEKLVAFRDTSGKIGIVAENCPHRGVSLFFGRNEETGFRCVYHGWEFDVSGVCVGMLVVPRSRILPQGCKGGASGPRLRSAVARRQGAWLPRDLLIHMY